MYAGVPASLRAGGVPPRSSSQLTNKREATIAVLSSAASTRPGVGSSALRVTVAPLLKPAVQSCLKNGYRLSLPLGPGSLPYPSPSILFPSPAAVHVTSGSAVPMQNLDELSRTFQAFDDGRRASDPDVMSQFEEALFEWVERECQQDTSDLSSAGVFGVPRYSEAGFESERLMSPGEVSGYGADVEDSPHIQGDQYKRGSRIHNRVISIEKVHARARAIRQAASARHTSVPSAGVQSERSESTSQARYGGSHYAQTSWKEPRFSLKAEVIPHTNSASPHQATQSRKSGGIGFNQDLAHPRRSDAASSSPSVPQVALPNESPRAQQHCRISVRGPPTPYLMASPHTTRQRVQRLRESEESIPIDMISDHQEEDTSGSTPTTADEAVDPFAALNPFGPKPANEPTIPSGPVCPRIAIPVDRSKSSEGVTRLQARRPPGLQLSKLPPSGAWAAAEIRAHGAGLAGRNMAAPAVFDPRIHGQKNWRTPDMAEPPTTAPAGTVTFKEAQEQAEKHVKESTQSSRARSKTVSDGLQSSKNRLIGLINSPRRATRPLPPLPAQRAVPDLMLPITPPLGTNKHASRTSGDSGAYLRKSSNRAGLGLSFGTEDGAVLESDVATSAKKSPIADNLPRPLPHRDVNAPEHAFSDVKARDTSREAAVVAKMRKHRSLPSKVESLLAEIAKPFDAGARRRRKMEFATANEMLEKAAPTPCEERDLLPPTARDAMAAWAKRTFELTAAKKSAGKVDVPPSAYLESAPTMPTMAAETADEVAEPREAHIVEQPVDVAEAEQGPFVPSKVEEPALQQSVLTRERVAELSPALSVRGVFRKENSDLLVALPSSAISMTSAGSLGAGEGDGLLPPGSPDTAVATALRARRDAQGLGLSPAIRDAALKSHASGNTKHHRSVSRAPCDPPSPRRIAFGILASQRLPEPSPRRVVSCAPGARPCGPRRRPSSPSRRVMSAAHPNSSWMGRGMSRDSALSTSPLIRQTSECSFGPMQEGELSAEEVEATSPNLNKTQETPLLIQMSSPLLNPAPASERPDIATSPLLAGTRSPLSKICDQAQDLIRLSSTSSAVSPPPLVGGSAQKRRVERPGTPLESGLSPRLRLFSPDLPSSNLPLSAALLPSASNGSARARVAAGNSVLDTRRDVKVLSEADLSEDHTPPSLPAPPQPVSALLALALAAEALIGEVDPEISASSVASSRSLSGPTAVDSPHVGTPSASSPLLPRGLAA